MSKKSIINSAKKAKSPKAQRLNQLRKLERHYEDWKQDFTIDFCHVNFMMAQAEKGNSKSTLYDYKYFYEHRLIPFLEEVFQSTPKELTIDSMGEELFRVLFKRWLEEKGLKPITVKTYMSNLRTFGNWCVQEGYLEFFNCPIKNVSTEIKEVYTMAELEKLLVKPPVTDFYDFRAYCMISLMLNTGARRRTLANIRICDLEIDEGYINFNVTKTNKVVRLGLERKTRRDLAEWLKYWRLDKGAEPTDYLFCNQYGEQMGDSSITQAIREYNLSRGVEKTSVHLFRHTFAKMWITSGGDIITLARVLTHSELEMVKHYSNLYGGDIKKEIQEHSVMSQMKTRSGKTLLSQKGGKESA